MMGKNTLHNSVQDWSAAAVKPSWRLPEAVPDLGPPAAWWKGLLIVAVFLQVAWVIALVAMATR